jgi:hypothetical protein
MATSGNAVIGYRGNWKYLEEPVAATRDRTPGGCPVISLCAPTYRVEPAGKPNLRIHIVTPKSRGSKMLETIAVILLILWVLGLSTATTMGGLIHVLLVIAVVVILVRVIQGRRVL